MRQHLPRLDIHLITNIAWPVPQFHQAITAESLLMPSSSDCNCCFDGKWAVAVGSQARSCSTSNDFTSLERAIDLGEAGTEKGFQSGYRESNESATNFCVLDGEHGIVEPGAVGKPLAFGDEVQTDDGDDDDTAEMARLAKDP